MAAPATAKRHAAKIVKRLKAAYPDATCALRHENAYQLLVATILSAQCTDERVNMVTPALFKRYPNIRAMAQAEQNELEEIIKSTGFFRAKAKNLRGCCQRLVAEYGGKVPQDLASMITLPGVGRKTANVVLGTAFGIPTGVVVDTHVSRVTYRLGLTSEKDPIKIERDLMAKLPENEWIDFAHLIIQHGRRICKARKPLCEQCFLEKLCPRIGVEAKSKKKN
jgi:endonuclease-3